MFLHYVLLTESLQSCQEIKMKLFEMNDRVFRTKKLLNSQKYKN